MDPDTLPEEPTDLEPEPAESTEPSDLDFTDMPCTDAGGEDADESSWEAFLPDDEWDPEPEPGDFWIEGLLLVFAFLCLSSAALTTSLV